MSTSSVLSLVFGGLAASVALFVPFSVRSALRTQRESAMTTGTVVAIENDVANESWIAHIGYEVDGRPFTLSVGSNGGYTVGEEVEVRYVTHEPSRAYLGSGHIWLEPLGALALALAFGVVAGVFVLLGRAKIL